MYVYSDGQRFCTFFLELFRGPLRICCSFYQYLPMVESHAIGYQSMGYTLRYTRVQVHGMLIIIGMFLHVRG